MGWVLWAVIVVIIAVIIFYVSYHLSKRRQFQKKQRADATLYHKVFESLHQHLSIDEAKNRFEIKAHANLLAFIQQSTLFPITQNDRFNILVNGPETYAKLFHEIQKATHHVHLLYYTIRDDEIGKKLLRLLIKKSQSGVLVRILVDGVGSLQFSEKTLKRLKHYGIQCGVFAPPKLPFLLHLNYRNHRKIAVIDGKVGFTGGLNIGDEYLHKDPKKGYWRDIHLLVEGEAVLLLQRIFVTDWYYVKNQKIEEDKQYFPLYDAKASLKLSISQPLEEQTILAQIVPSGPDMKKQIMKQVYTQMIRSAQRHIWLATPYFIPNRSFLNAIHMALDQGVSITLLVPYKTDSWFVQQASFHYYKQVLEKGGRIFLYKKGFYHAKIALIDDQIAKIGSANIDKRSFYYSFEAGVFVYDPEVCQTLKQLFIEDFQDSVRLTPEDIANRSFPKRLATSFSLLLSPWL
ncbi:cardiolipin synthase [Bacillus horti]|uniref:Cardiolipin synthase n=1 Tax=Caldalkalibacillus horti TaxID=77523 RepID=A0ABT9VVT8_9BACI|nr:cardiolipin synthase [Bacillus horti]MDQ0165093.1 cardiolipin synthase [Bacillus horti]